MSNKTEKLLVILSRGLDDERATIAWTIANGGINEGLDVTIFLVSNGVDLVRKGAVDAYRFNPEDAPLKDLMESFMSRGGKVWACPPCVNVRGYKPDNFIDGIKITGTKDLHAVVKEGAATFTF
jgi:predicted peroxiredoxin